MNPLAALLSSHVKAEVCRTLFGSAADELYLRELARRVGQTFSVVQREVERLERAGLVTRRKDGNRTYFRANKEHPFYTDLRSLVRKSSGLQEALSEALAGLPIRVAFVFGSIAAQKERPGSDVDLMVIGAVTLKEVVSQLYGLTEKIGREINPHAFSAAEYARRVRKRDHFLTTVMRAPKLFVIGSEHELVKWTDYSTLHP